VRFDTGVLRARARSRALPPLLHGIVPAPRREAADGAALGRRLAKLTEPERRAVVLELVRAEVASVLGHANAEEVVADRAFKELGFDSLAAVELRNRLSAAIGRRLSPTLVYDYPNVQSLVDHLLAELAPGDAGDGGADAGEVAIRQALMAIPIARLREAGLLDALMELDGDGDPASDDGDASESIDSMDAASLIKRSLEIDAPDPDEERDT
jgi:polyketide synthase 12